jgi:hypothetical protein
MTTFNVSTSTRDQVFPPGTVEDSSFLVELIDVNGVVVQSVNSLDGSASFTGVAAGDYVVTVSKNGVSASVNATAVDGEVHIQVPDVVSVTVA